MTKVWPHVVCVSVYVYSVVFLFQTCINEECLADKYQAKTGARGRKEQGRKDGAISLKNFEGAVTYEE